MKSTFVFLTKTFLGFDVEPQAINISGAVSADHVNSLWTLVIFE